MHSVNSVLKGNPIKIKKLLMKLDLPKILLDDQVEKLIVYLTMFPERGISLDENNELVKKMISELGSLDEITSNWEVYKKYEVKKLPAGNRIPLLGKYKEKYLQPLLVDTKEESVVETGKKEGNKKMTKNEVKSLVLDKVGEIVDALLNICEVEQDNSAADGHCDDMPANSPCKKENPYASQKKVLRGPTKDLFRRILNSNDMFSVSEYNAYVRSIRINTLKNLGYLGLFTKEDTSLGRKFYVCRGQKLKQLKARIRKDYGEKLK